MLRKKPFRTGLRKYVVLKHLYMHMFFTDPRVFAIWCFQVLYQVWYCAFVSGSQGENDVRIFIIYSRFPDRMLRTSEGKELL